MEVITLSIAYVGKVGILVLSITCCVFNKLGFALSILRTF
jgi:hypothetical protein